MSDFVDKLQTITNNFMETDFHYLNSPQFNAMHLYHRDTRAFVSIT